MRTLTFTDEEWEIVEAFAWAPRSYWSESARSLRAALARRAEQMDEPPVTGHDTVWLMAHEG